EVEASTALSIRVARAFDESPHDEEAASFARIATAVAKYCLNKRCPGHIYEALECMGGAGYIEESIMPRLYREAPLNSIWEGSGNVICLDVLRAMHRDPLCLEALMNETKTGARESSRIAAAVDRLQRELRSPDLELRARRVVELMGRILQGTLLVQHGPPAVAEAFLATRLDDEGGASYGTLPPGLDLASILGRATIA